MSTDSSYSSRLGAGYIRGERSQTIALCESWLKEYDSQEIRNFLKTILSSPHATSHQTASSGIKAKSLPLAVAENTRQPPVGKASKEVVPPPILSSSASAALPPHASSSLKSRILAQMLMFFSSDAWKFTTLAFTVLLVISKWSKWKKALREGLVFALTPTP